MATRQYIGARYVTKVYTNSQDPQSAAWESNTTYEPLTMVTYNNSSYLSRSDVPASVGNPVDNPTYWAQTGFYNGQIASLQSQIDDLRDYVYELRGRKFLLFGDSLGLGVSRQSGTPVYGNGWKYYAQQILGDAAVWVTDEGGGFTESIPHQWQYQLENFDFSSYNIDEFTDVVVLGGSNDTDDSAANIKTAIGTFVNYIRSHFPNINRIAIGVLTEPKNLTEARKRYIQCQDFGCEYISDLENLLCNASLYDETGHTHLSQSGYTFYSPYIVSAIVNSHVSYHFSFQNLLTVPTELAASISINASFTTPAVQYDIYNDHVDINLMPTTPLGQAISNGNYTVIDFKVHLPSGHLYPICPQSRNPCLFDNTDTVYVGGFSADSQSRTNPSIALTNDGSACCGELEFTCLSYEFNVFHSSAPSTDYKFVFAIDLVHFNVGSSESSRDIKLIIGSGMRISK